VVADLRVAVSVVAAAMRTVQEMLWEEVSTGSEGAEVVAEKGFVALTGAEEK
jgi:hypothetical protein